MIKKKLSDVVKDYIAKNPNVSNYSELAEQILSENPQLKVSKQTVRKLISSLIKDGVEIDIEKEERWQIDAQGKYFWRSSKGTINLPVSFIDQLFYEYSEKGLNLSQTEIINKHDLKVWEWNSIKNTLNLFKKSNIFSPYTVEITPVEELADMIASKMDQMQNKVGYIVEQKYKESIIKKYKKQIQEFTETEVVVQTIISELTDFLPGCEITPVLKEIEGSNNPIITVHIADIHFGAETLPELIPVVGKYSPEISRERLLKIAKEVNKLNAKEVHLFLAGDLIESFSGLNHLDSWKGLSKGCYGSQAVKLCYQLLIEFISSINNVKGIYGVSGNHDRAANDKKLETEGFIGDLIFEFLRVIFKDKMKVEYGQRLVSVEVDNIVHIMTHGDRKLTDLPPSELILEHGKQGKYHLLTSGHWHERKVKKDSKNFRHIVCPSIFPGNGFSVDLGYLSNPGFLITYNNGENKPTVIDYSI